MDGGPAGGVAVAQAVAGAAALFDCRSGELDSLFGRAEAVASLVVPPVLGVPGGLPVRVAGRVAAGLGVGGGPPAQCEEIARAALAAAGAAAPAAGPGAAASAAGPGAGA